ncbi:MarR family winged helix-turn-helix transcriptional regulator [Deinococcus pimensis]|uniref:MarR family winged helix-turn-helix transcriptional regulator n=1 Tax=Deinococcus pimensis TaxID=309888 RepID=UPI0004B90B7A|nr:MarR family transcriptional regulator [Deinococcus pimensis]
MSSGLPLSTRVWIDLDRVHSLLSRRIHGRMAEYGLTVPQYRVLRRLGEDGPRAPGALASDMGVTAGNLTGVLDRMEQQGLLTRARHEDDRRSVVARLTPRGEAEYARIVPEVRAYVAGLLSPLDERDLAHLQGVLERLDAHLCADAAEEVSA